jgi:hypothetical protein
VIVVEQGGAFCIEDNGLNAIFNFNQLLEDPLWP